MDLGLVDITNMTTDGLNSLLAIAGNGGNGKPIINNQADYDAFFALMVKVYKNAPAKIAAWLPRPGSL